MSKKDDILANGPKTNRWIDRAEWLYYVAERRGVKEHEEAAFKALQHFVEAREHRRIYEGLVNKAGAAHFHTDAAREHRRGVKAYEVASEMIFGKRQ